MSTKRETLQMSTHRGKTMRTQREGGAMCKLRGVSEETRPADTLTFDFQPPEPWENAFLLFKPASLWYFVLAAQGKFTLSLILPESQRIWGHCHAVSSRWLFYPFQEIRWSKLLWFLLVLRPSHPTQQMKEPKSSCYMNSSLMMERKQ